MQQGDNATGTRAITQASAPGEHRTAGLLLGLLGIAAFSFSFPSAKLALEGFDPWLGAFVRAAVAGILAAAYVTAVRAPRPTARQWRRLAIVAAGVIVGFPLFTSLALVTSDA